MTETIQTAMDRLMTISVEPQDYVAEDGLLYCGSCKTPKEAFFPNGKKLFGRDRHPAECRCRQATREKQEKEERARLHYEKVQRLKLQGFTDWAMQHWTFANDHGQNPQMQLAQRYVAHWPEMREKNVGLLLWGGVGTGKSFMAGCIANALMEQEVAVCMTNFARIMNELNNAFSGRNEVVDRLCGYPLLVIDDFGMERGTEYALEQINCILVKDLSRFGRNYIEVGRYLERIFPVMRVRLIAVTDNYDSQSAWKTSDSIMVPMRNLLNDAYCRDISVKIKSQLAVKRKRGDFVGSFATYGYQKDPSNHSKLIVDELAAENVQSIFRWKISGMSNQGIADRLNAGKVPSPAARKLQSGAKLSLHFRKSDEPPWSAKAVDRILHNDVYIGKLVQGKTRRLDYRSKKKMNVPMRDWTVVDNTHEAIVPAEQFELVQRILETETRRPNDAETVALFAGFLYCGDCGSRLVRRSASYKGKRYIYYQCSGSKQNKGSCTSHNLRDEKLYNIVRNALQMQIQIVMEEAEFVESIRQAQQEPYRVRRIERQIRQLTAEKAHTQGIKEKLYGDYADEILTREDFLNYNELYSKRIEEYSHKITELEAERQNLQTAPNAYPFLDVYRKYRKLEEITRPMVVELIEKIEVYEGNRVEITFRFHDEIADLLEELHQKQMGQHEVSA